MEPLGIEGAWVCTPQVYRDDRGSFLEAFRGEEFAADLGYRFNVAQVNCSVSRRGVIRGHSLRGRPSWPGEVRQLRQRIGCRCRGGPASRVAWLREVGGGAARRREPPFPRRGPRAWVHRCQRPGHRNVLVLDVLRAWQGAWHAPRWIRRSGSAGRLETAGEPVLSAKDAAAPSLDEALRAGALPRYADCAAYVAALRSRLRGQHGGKRPVRALPASRRSARCPRPSTPSWPSTL